MPTTPNCQDHSQHLLDAAVLPPQQLQHARPFALCETEKPFQTITDAGSQRSIAGSPVPQRPFGSPEGDDAREVGTGQSRQLHSGAREIGVAHG